MTVEQIADRLVSLCSKAEWKNAQRELFANDAVSIEPYETPGYSKETKGLENIYRKSDHFNETIKEYHSIKSSAPLIAESSFAIKMDLDLTTKDKGRMQMSEICVYEIKDGKIVSEQFFV